MFHDIILFLIIILIFGMIFYEYFYLKESFNDFPAGPHAQFVETSKSKYNPFTNMLNLVNSAVPLTPDNSTTVQSALNGIELEPTATSYNMKIKKSYDIPTAVPDTFKSVKKCEEAPVSCAAFDDSTFASNCGMSFDISGTDSNKKEHIGGLYIASNNKTAQKNEAMKARDMGKDPYTIYQPTIGSAKPGTFALTKDDCVIVKEKVDCSAKQSFSSPNCTQCYTTGDFARIGPESQKAPFNVTVIGNCKFKVSSPNKDISVNQQELPNPSTGKGTTFTIPGELEGTQFTITTTPLNGTVGNYYFGGFIEGATTKGPFRLDINHIIQVDQLTNAKPRINGSIRPSGFQCVRMIPGKGQSSMKLICLIPFSFINKHDYEAGTCSNGPVITKAESAIFLNSDACYNKDNQPGNYLLECLQSRWMQMGGTEEGTGYPRDAIKANGLQKKGDGSPKDIDTIVNEISDIMLRAQTGKDATGKKLSIEEWNSASMFATGKSITNPCDAENGESGPLSEACLSYLYMNQGVHSSIGPTYDMNPDDVASMTEQPFRNTFCQPGTSMDPTTPSGLKMVENKGGITAVKKYYNEIQRTANDDSLSNTEREDAINKCYGISLKPVVDNATPGPKQVFAVGPGYDFTRNQAASVCSRYGAEVATKAQLVEAQRNGADWCFSGWVKDSTTAQYPITTSVVSGCASRQGISEYTAPSNKAGVNCYGNKPAISTVNPEIIKPFNQQSWSQPNLTGREGFIVGDHEGSNNQENFRNFYSEVESGYLETAGDQPSCFSRLSPEQAQDGCDRLGDNCVGFSYAKDGSGFGCFKGNHNAGLNGNPAYMGYVKLPIPPPQGLKGRYIRLQYDHRECLNLAQIQVYSRDGGPNIIRPDMGVVKPDGWQGDVFPVRNFIDGSAGGNGSSFVHTSCNNIPWIEVDLRQMVSIYKIVIVNRHDCCWPRILGTRLEIFDERHQALNDGKGLIYQSDKIDRSRRGGEHYSFFPPNKQIKYE
jgi:hypothetical protein